MLHPDSHRMDCGTSLCERVHLRSDLSSPKSQKAIALKDLYATVLKVNVMSTRTKKSLKSLQEEHMSDDNIFAKTSG